VIITYYIGSNQNFETTWLIYCKVIAQHIEFPTTLALENPVVHKLDVKGANNSIKAGKTNHIGASVYHVFINISYDR